MKKLWIESLCLQFSFSCITDLHIPHFVLDILHEDTSSLLPNRHLDRADNLPSFLFEIPFSTPFLDLSAIVVWWHLLAFQQLFSSFLGPSLFGFFLRIMGSFICLEWSVIVWLFLLVVVIVILIFIRLILLPFLFGSLWCIAAWSRLRGTRKIWISRSFYFFTCILESSKFGETMTRIRDFALQLFEEQNSWTPYATISTKNSRN